MAEQTGFRARLRAWRDAAGVSQTQLDEAIGKGRGYVAGLESGRMRPPTREVLDAIATALSLDPDFAWGVVAADRLEELDPDLAQWHREQVEKAGNPIDDYDRAVLDTLHKPEFEALYSNLAFEESAASLAAVGLLDETDRDLILLARQLTGVHRQSLVDLAGTIVDIGGGTALLATAVAELARKVKDHDMATWESRPRHHDPAEADLLRVLETLAGLPEQDLARLLRAFRETAWAVRHASGGLLKGGE